MKAHAIFGIHTSILARPALFQILNSVCMIECTGDACGIKSLFGLLWIILFVIIVNIHCLIKVAVIDYVDVIYLPLHLGCISRDSSIVFTPAAKVEGL